MDVGRLPGALTMDFRSAVGLAHSSKGRAARSIEADRTMREIRMFVCIAALIDR